MARQQQALTPKPIQLASNAELLAELRRRYIAYLFAGVRVDGKNEAVTDAQEKGCVSVLKHLHTEQELRLETMTREELKKFGERVAHTLSGNELADGSVSTDEEPIPGAST